MIDKIMRGWDDAKTFFSIILYFLGFVQSNKLHLGFYIKKKNS